MGYQEPCPSPNLGRGPQVAGSLVASADCKTAHDATERRNLGPTLERLRYADLPGADVHPVHGRATIRTVKCKYRAARCVLGAPRQAVLSVESHARQKVSDVAWSLSLVSGTTSLVAALLFAIHPVHTEAVSGVVGRAELLASVFFLLALLNYSRVSRLRRGTRWRSLMWTMCLITCAMLCKEQGITVIAVCALQELFVSQKLSPRDLLAFCQVVAGGKGEGPGLDQLYASYYDRMHKCTRGEFLTEIGFWSAQYNVPQGETCGIDSANMSFRMLIFNFHSLDPNVVRINLIILIIKSRI